jgi:hypothetical protein
LNRALQDEENSVFREVSNSGVRKYGSPATPDDNADCGAVVRLRQ